jgi:hypothetical protein
MTYSKVSELHCLMILIIKLCDQSSTALGVADAAAKQRASLAA